MGLFQGRGEGMKLFWTEQLSMSFGGLKAVDQVDLEVHQGETLGLIGPNGSGKTTFFNLITGIYRPTQGNLFFWGESLLGLEPYQRSRKGIARTFQNSRLFLELSVLDNVLIGRHRTHRSWILDALIRRGRLRAELTRDVEVALGLLSLFNEGLPGRCFERASGLPQIDRRRVEICRALAAEPKLLLLDEPTAGMTPEETFELMQDLSKVKEGRPDLSLIVIEHDMFVIEGITDRVVAFNYGRKIAEGTFEEVAKDREVREAYLGKEVGHAGG